MEQDAQVLHLLHRLGAGISVQAILSTPQARGPPWSPPPGQEEARPAPPRPGGPPRGHHPPGREVHRNRATTKTARAAETGPTTEATRATEIASAVAGLCDDNGEL